MIQPETPVTLSAPGPKKRRSIWPRLIWIGALLLLYALSYHGFSGSVVDEVMPLSVTAQLLNHHTLAINPWYAALMAWGAPSADPSAPIYSKYAIGQSLLMLPAYAAGQLVPAQLNPPSHAPDGQPFLPAAPLLLTYTLGSLITVLSSFGLMRIAQALGFDEQSGAWLALLYGVTTFAWPYAKTLYNEPATACALIGVVYGSLRYRQSGQRRTGLLTGICLGAAILLRTSSVLYVPLTLLYCWPPPCRDGRRLIGRWSWLAWGIAVGVLVTAIYDGLRYGNVLQTGYEAGFGRAPWKALLGYVISPSRSLFLFAPVLLLIVPGALALRRQLPRETLYLIGLALVPVALYAGWWAWDGGASLGPRFLLPSVAMLLLLITPLIPDRRWRAIWIGLGVIGFGVQLLANLPTTADVFGALAQGQPDLSAINWQWDRSLLANFWAVYRQRQIDSALLRALPIHDPLLLAGLFVLLSTALVAIMIAAIRALRPAVEA